MPYSGLKCFHFFTVWGLVVSDNNRNIINIPKRCHKMRVPGWWCGFDNISVVTKIEVMTRFEILLITYDMSFVAYCHLMQNRVRFLLFHKLFVTCNIHPIRSSLANHPVASIGMTPLLKFGSCKASCRVHQITSFCHLLSQSKTSRLPFPYQR